MEVGVSVDEASSYSHTIRGCSAEVALDNFSIASSLANIGV